MTVMNRKTRTSSMQVAKTGWASRRERTVAPEGLTARKMKSGQEKDTHEQPLGASPFSRASLVLLSAVTFIRTLVILSAESRASYLYFVIE